MKTSISLATPVFSSHVFLSRQANDQNEGNFNFGPARAARASVEGSLLEKRGRDLWILKKSYVQIEVAIYLENGDVYRLFLDILINK